ncbi:MAG: hypothetical protein J6P29_04215, partial [Acetobacter sp.]|nr:hypothetical protein [Acetobacter sp.]
SAVQEMSAGLVKIIHSERHCLTIPQTQGATWETGTWDNISANEVNERLGSTMTTFREAEKNNPSIEPVLFEIEWPIRLAERKKELGLPEGTRFTILDLPGLRSVNDERNGPVIRANIAKAFCLVAYNAEETDRTKQKILLNEVVNQVMALSYGTVEEDTDSFKRQWNISLLQRMLFLLNRVDAFYRHDDASEQLEKFKKDITIQLREKLTENMGEYKEVIDKIELAEICSLPALLAVEANSLWEKPDKQSDILDKLDKQFQQIFPKGYFEDNEFPRNFKKITGEQRKELITQTFESSYGNSFERSLSSCIAESFFELVLNEPVRGLFGVSTRLLQILDIRVEENTQRTVEEAKAKLRNLEQAKTDLMNNANQILQICQRALKVAESNESVDKKFGDLRGPCFETGEYIGMPNILLPVIDAMDDILHTPYTEIVLYIDEFMKGVDPVPPPLMVALKELEDFNEGIEQLRKSAYYRYYQDGCAFLEDKDSAVEKALVAFMPVLSKMAAQVIEKALRISSHRIQVAFTTCSDTIFAKLRDTIAQETTLFTEFPGLYTIFDGEMSYTPPPPIEITCSYTVDKETRVFTKTEEIPVNFLNKWLFGTQTRKVTEERQGIMVPSLGELLKKMWGDGERESAAEMGKLLSYVLNDLVGPFMEQLTQRIDLGVQAYQQAIEKSVGTISAESEEKNRVLEDYKKRIVDLLGRELQELEEHEEYREYQEHA